MARNRTPQTFEKRRREMEKKTEHKAKIEQRHARKAAKRELAARPPEPAGQGGEDTKAAVVAPAPADAVPTTTRQEQP